MTTPPQANPLVERVLSGENRGLQELAADGVLPLPQEELIAVQVRLAEHQDSTIAAKAKASLDRVDRSFLVSFLRSESAPETLSYFARHHADSVVLETVLQRRGLPVEDVIGLARRVGTDLQEILLLRQDLIVESPKILDALQENPDLSRYSKRRIQEYRQHLLGESAAPRLDRPPKSSLEEPLAEALDELSEEEREEVVGAVEDVLEEIDAAGEVDAKTGLSEAQVKALPAPIRAKLARGASRQLRTILLRDPNPQVATTVLQASAVTESEIEMVAANRHISEEVLSAIAARREWNSKYAILHNLVRNPRTPVGIAVKFVARLSVRDLGLLRMDRNVPDAVRQAANRLYRVKTQ